MTAVRAARWAVGLLFLAAAVYVFQAVFLATLPSAEAAREWAKAPFAGAGAAFIPLAVWAGVDHVVFYRRRGGAR